MRQQAIGAGLMEMMEALEIGSEEQLAALLLHSGCSAMRVAARIGDRLRREIGRGRRPRVGDG